VDWVPFKIKAKDSTTVGAKCSKLLIVHEFTQKINNYGYWYTFHNIHYGSTQQVYSKHSD